ADRSDRHKQRAVEDAEVGAGAAAVAVELERAAGDRGRAGAEAGIARGGGGEVHRAVADGDATAMRVVGRDRESARAGFDERARADERAVRRERAADHVKRRGVVQRRLTVRAHRTSGVTKRAAVENQIGWVAATRAEAAG